MSCETPHFDTVYALLPTSLKSGIDDLLSRATRESAARHTLDQLVRFSLNHESSNDDPDSRQEWNSQGKKVEKALSSLVSGTEKGKKRTLEEDPPYTSGSDLKAKKVKLGSDSVGGTDDPIFSLHAISTSAPVRKKVHITIHQNSIRFTHATSAALEASIPLSSLTRAFLIFTPGKSKPHWTVIVLTGVEQNQIIFGLDAIPSSLTTTIYPASPLNHPKGTEAKAALKQFLSRLPSHVISQEPSSSNFRSAAGEPFLDTYLRAKDGHLMFFEDGILFGEKKPCVWIGMEEIDSVRSLSATGRTFSLFVRRTKEVIEGEETEEKEGEETEFSLIDGKNQDSVARWVQENRHRFGIPPRPTYVTQNGTEADVLAANEDTPEEEAGEDSEDLGDSDFKSDSESDGGSASSDSSDSKNPGGEEEEEEEEEEEQSGSDVEDEEQEGVSLDPSKHPLLREGAVPRMSRATLDAVVGLVEKDLINGSVKGAQAGDDEDVDELED